MCEFREDLLNSVYVIVQKLCSNKPTTDYFKYAQINPKYIPMLQCAVMILAYWFCMETEWTEKRQQKDYPAYKGER